MQAFPKFLIASPSFHGGRGALPSAGGHPADLTFLAGDKSFREKNRKSKLLEHSCLLLQGMHYPIYCFGSQSLKEDTSFEELSCIAEEEQSMLDAVLLSQWEDRMLKDFFKYDVTTSEIKVVTGNMKFLSQLNEGQITDHQSKSEGNTLHEFNPLVFDCMKHPEELLFCLASSKKAKSELTPSASVPDCAVLVIINVTPVEYGHVYLVPCASNKLYPFLDARSIEISTRLAAEINNQSFRVFYDCYRPNCSAVYFEQTCAASRAISAWECGGYFLFADRYEFDRITEDAMVNRLSSFSLDDHNFEAVKQLCCSIASKFDV
ncbi:hypothetical protein V6N11_029883 [Hibiscus sabdariffa]|uniref:GDPGP1-like N-terminal domain-containing protein n=1 Tax=Hibiscus sabdariffa TaxID=183260 RepID=A0ABR2PJC4_9ROSI